MACPCRVGKDTPRLEQLFGILLLYQTFVCLASIHPFVRQPANHHHINYSLFENIYPLPFQQLDGLQGRQRNSSH
nr:MAG TPA: hypothetical protein [Bacteriophage sp.]